jgi:hypothetical protein
VSTKIYVEGGGEQKRTVTACRAAFGKYFERVVPAGRQPRVVVCGSRQQAYKDFVLGLNDPRYERVLLLVDAEDHVVDGDGPWEHLRKHDGWARPNDAEQDSGHLMVQCMESWFMADKESLVEFYGQGFNANALPARVEIELISKRDVSGGLESATRHTQKGEYHKTHHGFAILAAIDPQKVEAVSPFAKRLHRRVRG